MRIQNLTPHPVNFPGLVIPTDGDAIRVPEKTSKTTPVVADDGSIFPVVDVQADRSAMADLLPDPEPDTMIIVSRMVAEAAPDRDDLVWPHPVSRVDGVLVAQGLARVPR